MKYTKDRIPETIQKIQDYRKFYEEVCDEAREFSLYCTDYAKSELSPFDVRVYDVCGMHGKDAKISVSTKFRSFSGKFLHYFGGGDFRWSKEQGETLYEFDICDGVSFPYDTQLLLDRCKKISEDLGIPCEIVKTTLESKNSGVINNSRDALSRHPGGKNLGDGYITYSGWDCKDRWVVIEDSEGKHLYYGHTAHGGGYELLCPSPRRLC